MHFPKGTLLTCRFGSLGCDRGFVVDGNEREVSVYDPHLTI
jgi:hypothetical protein